MERMDPADQFETSINSLEGYRWDNVMTFLKDKEPVFLVGNPVPRDEHAKVQLQVQIVSRIEKSLEFKSLVLLVGAHRTGTTTVGKDWVDREPKKRTMDEAILWTTEDYENFLEAIPEKEIFIDEFTGKKEEMFDLVENLIKKQSKKLVLRVFSHDADRVEEKLRGKGLDFGEVEVLPQPKDKMREYLGYRLGLESNDPLVVSITDMAGGSLLIAHSICANLKSEAEWSSGEMSLSKFRDILEKTYDQIGGMTMAEWTKDKGNTPERFRNTYPSPILQESSY